MNSSIKRGPQAFTRGEFDRRLNLVKGAMREKDIDTLLVTSAPNTIYLTGYTAASFYVPWGLIVRIDRDEPVFVVRKMDYAAAIYQSYLDVESIVYYDETCIGDALDFFKPYDTVLDIIEENHWADHGLGIEMESMGAMPKVEKRFPNTRIVDCSNMIDWLRIIKSEEELVVMRQAGENADAAMRKGMEMIKPGVVEATAAAEMMAVLIRGVNGNPSNTRPEFSLCATPLTGTAHIEWRDVPFEMGSQVNVELGGVRHSYHVGMMRTFSLGEPSEKLKKAYDAELAAYYAAMEAIRPGALCHDVAYAFNTTLEKNGYRKESRCGYSIGILWTEQTASFKLGDQTVLKPNMVYHLMLGNWMEEDFGIVLGNTVRVTENGPEVLTKLPVDLITL